MLNIILQPKIYAASNQQGSHHTVFHLVSKMSPARNALVFSYYASPIGGFIFSSKPPLFHLLISPSRIPFTPIPSHSPATRSDKLLIINYSSPHFPEPLHVPPILRHFTLKPFKTFITQPNPPHLFPHLFLPYLPKTPHSYA